MTTTGTWTVPITTEGIDVQLTENGLWIEIRYPSGLSGTRSFISAVELHRLARIPAEARAAALAVLDNERGRITRQDQEPERPAEASTPPQADAE